MSGPPRQILVTGGAGFIGSHLVDALIERGDAVRVLDCLHPAAHRGEPDYLNPAATYVWGDLRDPATAERAVTGVDAVCHQAAMVGLGLDLGDAPEYVSSNSLATAVLIGELARAEFSGRLVLAGSMVIYGEGSYRCRAHGSVKAPVRTVECLEAGDFEPRCSICGSSLIAESVPEDAEPDPRSVYASTKLDQERLCSLFGRERGTSVSILRYHNVYGPRMPRDTPYAGVASIFRSALETGRAPRVFEDGAQLRDFVHVSDIARANLLALDIPAPRSNVFNIASGRPVSVGEMANELARATGGPEPEITGEYRIGDVRHVFASVSRAKAELGFEAEVPFADGIIEFARAPLRGIAAPIG